MVDVKDDIRYLIQLAKKDMAIKRRIAIIEGNPVKIDEINRDLSEMDRQISQRESELESLQKEKRHLKSVIDSELEKIKQKKMEESKISSNTAYRAWEHEMEYLKKKLDEHEDKMLADLERIDQLEKEISEFNNITEDKKKALIEKREKLEREMENSRERLDVIEDEKKRVLPHISEGVRKQYRRVLDAKGDSGVANLKNDICQGCFSKVPPQVSHEVRKNYKIIRCENCGRILVYYAAEDEQEKE